MVIAPSAISLPRLRWVAILLPTGFVLTVELGLYLLLNGAIPSIGLRVLTAAVIVAGVVVFSLAIFRLLQDKEQTILAQARQARVLHQIGAEVSAHLDADRLIALVVGRARELLGADAAGLARIGPDGGTLHWQHFVGSEGTRGGFQAIRLRPGEGIAGFVVATGQPLQINDLAAGLPPGLESAPILEAEHLRSALAVPLRSHEQPLGALMVANRAPRIFTGEEVTLLTSLANQVAVAVTNAELYARARLAAERLERLIESSGDAIITVDLQGRILSWNRGAEMIYGWSREEAIGSVLPMVPPDLLEDARRLLAGMLASGEIVANYETERLRKDGQRIPVVVTGSPIRNAAGDIVGILGISKDMSAHRQLEEHKRRLALLEDRERIAMELHDGVIQSLYAVGLGLEAVAQVLETDPPLARMRLAQARDSINAVMEEVRNYIFGLRPDTFETQGLVAGLGALAEELRINALVNLDVDLAEGADLAFGAQRALEIFQVAREALANVARHSAATRASLSLRPEGRCWVLRVWDNGVGFDPDSVGSAGFGLSNMRERARRLGGDIKVTSQPGEGTEVRLVVPIHGGEEA